jgi:two-component system, NtrC family, nitrogen regulation sensor histidine kinase NtrY
VDLHPGLPPVLADREQMKRVIVNLVDNAAEAMNDSPVRTLTIRTRPGNTTDTVEVWVTDTGSGVSTADKEKLFLPYFSTKERGTGLGLAIVSHVITEHRGRVRVEDNYPAGARFIVELAAIVNDPESGERLAHTADATAEASPVAAKG